MPGDSIVTYQISTNLVNFPNVSITFNIIVTYTCPDEDLIDLINEVQYFEPWVYDLSGGSASYPVSDFQILPTSCSSMSGGSVWEIASDGSEVEDTNFSYNYSASEIDLQVSDPSLYTSQEVR